MAGLIQQQMQPVPGMQGAQAEGADAEAQTEGGTDEPQETSGSGDSFDFSPQSVQSQMQVPPQLQEAFTRVVTAGMKVMFAPQMRAQVLQLLNSPGDLGEKLGKAIAGLMLLLFQQSNKTLPPKVIIPAALVLLSHAVDALNQAGHKVEPQVVAQASQVAIETLLQKFGIDPSKLQANIQQHMQGGEQPPQDQQGPPPDQGAADEQTAPMQDAEQAPMKQGA